MEEDTRRFRPVLLLIHSIDQRLNVTVTPVDVVEVVRVERGVHPRLYTYCCCTGLPLNHPAEDTFQVRREVPDPGLLAELVVE